MRPGIERQQQRSIIFQIALVVLREVRLIAFGKAEQEHRAITDAICNHGTESTTPAFARARHPLLDEPMTEIGVDQAAFRAANRLTQRCICDPLLALKAPEAFRPEDSHTGPRTQTYST